MLVNGKWMEKWQPVQASDDEGRFIRQDSGFRHRIGAHSPDGFTPEAAVTCCTWPTSARGRAEP